MKRNILRLSLCAFLLLGIFHLDAQAGFYLGFQVGNSYEKPKIDGIKISEDTGFLWGVQGGLRLLMFSLEGTYYRSNHSLVPPEGCPTGCTEARDLGYSFLGGNIKLGIPLIVVYPYLTFGYGIYSADIKGLGDGTDWSYNIGAGLEVRLGRIGLFAEGRYEDFNISIESLDIEEILDFDFGGFNLVFGFNYHF